MQERNIRHLDSEGLWLYALRLLGRSAQSTGQVREKLRRRAAQATDVDEVLTRLKNAGYLDDRRFAEGFATARLSGEKLGKMRVLHDLRRRHVAPPLAESTVRRVYQGVDEEALIEDWIRRKYRLAAREGLFQEDKDVASAFRRLARAGFRTGEIVKVLKRFARNPELLDNLEPSEEAPE